MDFDGLIQDYKPKKNPFRAPGFSFGYRSEEDKLPLSPGPGSYNAANHLSTKHDGIKFTHSPRFDSKNATGTIPGPGSYYKDSLDTTMNQSVATSKNGSVISPKTHGTFSKSQRMGLFNNTSPALGPGQYGVKRDFETLPKELKASKSRFEKSSERSEKLSALHTTSDTPGPGQYEITQVVTSKQSSSSRFSMPQATRSFANVKQMADQGLKGDVYRYNKHENIGQEGPKFSFGSGKRSELSPPSKGPGPTSYFTEIKDPKEKYLLKGTFSQAARKIGEGSKGADLGPSPAEYQLDIGTFKKGAKISKSRKESPEISRAPGPGQYDILDEFNEKKRALEKKIQMQQSLLSARSPKNDRINSEPNDFGDQVMESQVTEPTSPTRSPKKGAIKQMWVEDIIKKSVSPGPMYMVQTDNIEMNSGIMGTKFSTWIRPNFISEALKRDIPGPGKYDMLFNESETTQPIKFATSKRKDNPVLLEYTLEIPGPEKYNNLPPKQAYGGVFGKAERKLGPEEVLSPLDRLRKRKEINLSGNLDVIRE